MKKTLLFLTMFVLFVCTFVISASAVDIEYDGVFYDANAKTGTATVSTKNRTATTEIVNIPSTFTLDDVTYKVTAISTDAFYGNKTVKEIRILSEHITKIPSNMIASTYDGALEKIYIDFSNITSIGSAGLNPSNQTNGNNPIANKFYYYDAKAFIENGEDVVITEPDFSNVTSIGAAAFQGANFEKLTIPAAVYLNNQMFRKTTIKELVIEGEDRTTIEYYSFQDCRNLEKITIKSRNLKSIGNDVFSCATALKEIYIDMSKCESVRWSAFQFANQYDSGNKTVQWYNLEGEKIVDLSSMKLFYDKAFCSSNLGSAKIIWPNAIEVFENQVFRKCNINDQPMIISAAEGKELNLPYYSFDGNNPSVFICNEGVTTIKASFTDCQVVLLAPSVMITGDGNFKGSSTVYYKSFAEGSKSLGCETVQITDGTAYNYGACGIIAKVTTADGENVTVGTVSHTTVDAIDNTFCPVGKVLVADCKYCDYVAYYVDGEEVEKKEHEYNLVGAIAYTSYFELGYKTTKCECGAEKASDIATESAIFVDYGYSYTEVAINGSFSMSQFFGINQGALAAYIEATGNTFEYGLVVSVSDNPLAEENSDLIALNKTFITTQNKFKHDYFAINVSGIKDGTEEGTKDTREKALTFCAYVIDNGKVYYLDDGKTLEVATQKSYNDILGK